MEKIIDEDGYVEDTEGLIQGFVDNLWGDYSSEVNIESESIKDVFEAGAVAVLNRTLQNEEPPNSTPSAEQQLKDSISLVKKGLNYLQGQPLTKQYRIICDSLNAAVAKLESI